jgi:nitric oxide reductase NorD protein
MEISAVNNLASSAKYFESIGAKSWTAVKLAFPDAALDRWVHGLDQITSAVSEPWVALKFAISSVAVAQAHGVETALITVPTAVAITKSTGSRATSVFFDALPKLSDALKDNASVRTWLRTIEELSNLAPESVETVIRQSASILNRLSVLAFRSWVLNGVRLSSSDSEQRAAYFSKTDISTLAAFERNIDDVMFADVERSLRAFLVALWKLRPAVRTVGIQSGGRATRRSSFDGTFILLPAIYSGVLGTRATAHYHAAIAHIGAHLIYTRERFPVGSLKPLQIALAGLIEDARVEALATLEYPGLGRLWAGFHNAQPGAALTAEILMLRLSRALIDPSYVDNDPWVNKGRMLFFDCRDQWGDPGISRRIGGLLGNDLGQMRIQFSAKTYIVEPSYRDDNTGVWDFGEPAPEQSLINETILESVRVTKNEDKESAERREPNDIENAPPSLAARVREVPEDSGIPIARHHEWDHISGMQRNEWTTIVEFLPQPAPASSIDTILEEYADVELRIARLVKSAKVSRPVRMRRQPQGDRLDLDACIRAAIDRRAGFTPEARIYETNEMRSRDLSVLALLDISESTRDRVKDTTTTVIALERAATALLAQAMSGLGDPFAIHAFCSKGREEVRYYRVKDFGENYSSLTRARLAGLRGMLSTRLGAALRQAGQEIIGQATHRKLVLVITDGEPSDIDVADRKYLVEDARKAVHELAHMGIDVFCVGLDNGGESYLSRIFGVKNYLMINRLEALPQKLPMLYFRLTV